MKKEIGETAHKMSSESVGRAMVWTFKSLDEDHELERVFNGMPGFCNPILVDNPLSSLAMLDLRTMHTAFRGLLERTLSSDLISEKTKKRRFVTCVKPFMHPKIYLRQRTSLKFVLHLSSRSCDLSKWGKL
jgi:hypothetical protein